MGRHRVAIRERITRWRAANIKMASSGGWSAADSSQMRGSASTPTAHGPKLTLTRLRLAALAAYNALSAAADAFAGGPLSRGNVATPNEAVTAIDDPPHGSLNGRQRAAQLRSAALDRDVLRHLRQDQQELLATVAAAPIAALLGVPLHQIAEGPQRLATGKMSIAVIDPFEVVEINDDCADGIISTLGGDQLPAG